MTAVDQATICFNTPINASCAIAFGRDVNAAAAQAARVSAFTKTGAS